MKQIVNHTYDEERALYGSVGVEAIGCRFDGPADGESAFKESRDIAARDCFFNLRYPFWHVNGLVLERGEMTELCRAALWYCDGVDIRDSRLHGIKALRECAHVDMTGCDVLSPEFGWFSRDVRMQACHVQGEYFMMRAERLHFDDVTLKGKYSFQYITDSVFDNCVFDTKDAFWHAKNVTVRNSIIRGEYLAWYCENVTFENCVITGTQPLCYCRGLRLIGCEMHEADLAFEKSEVEATVTTPVISIKNPAQGHIRVPQLGTCIMDDPTACGQVTVGAAI